MKMKKLGIFTISMMMMVNLVFASVQVRGADTMDYLVKRLADVYMKGHPGSSIVVAGGGSGTGIAELINGNIDIANSARVMNSTEETIMKSKGGDPRAVVIAVYGLSVIVNPANPVSNLSMDTIGRIFSGEITNWSQIGGPNKRITLYGRQPNSGTFFFFSEHVMKEAGYSVSMNQLVGHSQIVDAVKKDAASIGYVGIEYAVNDAKLFNGVKLLNVSMYSGGVAYNPAETRNIYNGKYPLARGLIQYVNGLPQGDVLDFLKWELSPEGQKAVVAEGFYSAKGVFIVDNDKAFNKRVSAY
jgi:phosphate transport system substrate-binding protein